MVPGVLGRLEVAPPNQPEFANLNKETEMEFYRWLIGIFSQGGGGLGDDAQGGGGAGDN